LLKIKKRPVIISPKIKNKEIKKLNLRKKKFIIISKL